MTIQVQDVPIHVVEEGAGIPTVFLHGNPDSSIMWRGVIAEMKQRFRCLAPDLPGFGFSSIPRGFDYSLEAMAGFVNDLMNAAGIREPANLIVHDFGGPYGLAWAVRHPERVRSIAAINTIFFADYKWHPWARIWRTPLIGELSMMTNNWRLFRSAVRKGSPGLSEEHLRETYALLRPQTRRMVLKLYRATDPEKFRGWEDQLLELTTRVPTCVLWGDRDPYIDSKYAERFGAKQVWHFPEYGHWLPAEAPKEVAARLMGFFTE